MQQVEYLWKEPDQIQINKNKNVSMENAWNCKNVAQNKPPNQLFNYFNKIRIQIKEIVVEL